jgi:hypothetical protein
MPVAATHTVGLGHDVVLHTQADPAALQRGVAPPHEKAQQTLPVPVASVSQLPLVHWVSAPGLHAVPLSFLFWQVPALHHRPGPHAASVRQEPQVVVVSQ